jgi:hypothetical protein
VNSKKGQIEESPQERALAQVAHERLADYKTRWQPLQQRTAEVVQSMGKADSWERRQATGKAASDTEQAFGAAEEKADAADMNQGIGAGSSAFRLGQTDMAADKGRARGLVVESGEQAIDDAYIGGLQQLMAIGRGQSTQAARGLGASALIGSRHAEGEAQLAASRRSGQRHTAGVLVGGAMRTAAPYVNQGINSMGSGFGGNHQYFDAADPG